MANTLTSQLQEAIKTASIHVAIFSPGYADSEWCLNELVLMVESRAPIIPVFYNVQPTDLRHTQDKDKGKYAESLRILKQRKGMARNRVTIPHPLRIGGMLSLLWQG